MLCSCSVLWIGGESSGVIVVLVRQESLEREMGLASSAMKKVHKSPLNVDNELF